MALLHVFLTIIVGLCSCPTLADLLTFTESANTEKLAGNGLAPEIWIASNDYNGVSRTAYDIAIDFGRVTGTNGTVKLLETLPSNVDASRPVIIAGSVGNSTLIDGLVSSGKLDASQIDGLWESYTSTLIRDPVAGLPWALVVAGSDQRGAIFGLYDISETIGVSPWYWWADVSIKTKTGIWVTETPKVQGPPSVKYRGVFINDEAPALTAWVNARFKKSASGYGFTNEFYKLFFELCLRLKANYIWPAMWSASFYVDDLANGPTANDWGLVMGTSHHEPMARPYAEQHTNLSGTWDWGTNKDNITDFFKGGVERAKGWETIYTMGMRGDGDAASPDLTSSALEEVIGVQQSVLEDVLGVSNLEDVPQTWVLYKEVGGYYQAGMAVPESISLLWTDDNVGNLLRVPLANETGRAGGAGVYYHFDYVGSPRSYKWINSIQLVKTWEQMHLAYERGANQVWIANIGDIKALEVPTTHFLDMAYDMSNFATPEATNDWIVRWATREFGPEVAASTAQIFTTYGRLIVRRKYELLSQTPFAFSTAHYDEAERVLEEWTELLALAQSVYDGFDQARRTPFFQMVLHPVLAGKTVVELYIKANLNAWTLQQRRTSTNQLALDVQDLFRQDQVITKRYNQLNGGKWNHFADQVHIGYTSWNDPVANTMPNVSFHGQSNVPKSGPMGVSVQGSALSAPGDPERYLLSMDPYMGPTEIRYLDVYTRDNQTFSYKVTANESFVRVDNSSGVLSSPGGMSDVRCLISVDWNAAPDGLTWVGLRVQATNATRTWATTAHLPVNKTIVPTGFNGFIESNGVVSIEAEHYQNSETKNGLSYVTIPGYGRTLSGVKLWPVTADSQTTSSGPKLTYSFYSFSSPKTARLIVSLGSSLNHDPSRPLRYAFSIDNGSIMSVQPVPNTPMGTLPSGWTDAVISGGWQSISSISLPAGAHKLSLWLLEPGIVVQKVVLDLSGYKSSSLGPPESRQIE
ncbi:hypothetical protein PFICI_00949 [Pestalotiopsis fici W106-1]|uniref:Gylcosyl hydrolase 115 C-terminal domain-containing protein n=1 Tax=Pestalotiopsis fici (strain W106-1 / CGMCC3.15140) TaxID=1229662 RepID=W3XPD5_PESFW|nr:uncharacterized protein PFICI_00949 [Pestalotiopsis fici W106-1]ETS87121.1 hypothetical protein PFICI_00949 [Pestalotiopsis fici W106-1]